ncbi:MAG: hypothetical protein WDO74_04715 [Pseudomonadota bacterium]
MKARQLLIWLWRGWRWHFLILTLIVPMRLIRHVTGYDFETCLKIHGGVLQFLTLGFVLLGIWETLRRFQKPGPLRQFVAWVKQFPIRRPRRLEVGVAVEVNTALSLGRSAGKGPGDGTIEARIAALEANLLGLQDTVASNLTKQDADKTQLMGVIDVERAERQQSVLRVSELLETINAGGVNDLYLAAAWSFFATLFGTVGSNHLEPWFRAFHSL